MCHSFLKYIFLAETSNWEKAHINKVCSLLQTQQKEGECFGAWLSDCVTFTKLHQNSARGLIHS
jgi:hypothetical protein